MTNLEQRFSSYGEYQKVTRFGDLWLQDVDNGVFSAL